ncbi:MAG: hypothetical protein ACLFP6_11590 [Spirochaetaceae bacterium]
MRGERRGSQAMVQSLSELAFILFFLAVAAAVLLQARHAEARAALAAAEAELAVLDEEVAFLRQLMDEKQYGVVPCWRRPEGEVPQIAGGVRIAADGSWSVWNAASGEERELDDDSEPLAPVMETLFSREMRYADEMGCYIRVSIENGTPEFAPYERARETVVGLGLVVANE